MFKNLLATLMYGNLLKDGYAIYHELLPATMLERLRVNCNDRIHGTLTSSGEALTEAIDPLDHLHLALIREGAYILSSEMPDTRYLAGVIIPKYPQEPMRTWHVDFWNYSLPEARQQSPAIVGVLFYLNEAQKHTGALMLVPESHTKSVGGHEKYIGTRDEIPESVTVEVPAGGIIILDSRTMHAVTASKAAHTRICITIWYMLGWAGLSEQMKATAMLSAEPKAASVLGPLMMNYAGSAVPVPHEKHPRY